jgi:photosystem II stability/assembly factor-like uncharacterized protein
MEFRPRITAFLVASILAFGGSSCKSSQSNANKQGVTEAKPKPAKWVAQYRSPASLSYSGLNLSVFFYSAISVVSPSIVFVCGDTPSPKGNDSRVGVVVRTTNGGETWTDTPIELPGMAITRLNSIHFVSPEVGWVVGADSGDDGVLLKTTDGGSSWSVIRLTQKQTPLCVFFTDVDNGWIGGSTPLAGDEDSIGGPSAILATTDGGNTWHPQYTLPLSIIRIFFVDKVNGWASGTKGVIYNTTDGGRTWDKQRTEIEAGDGPIDFASDGAKQFEIRGLQFIDKEHGFAAANAAEQQAGRMLVTSNGGASWHRQWIVNGSNIRDMFFVSPTEGWALSDQGPYVNHTVDGGRSWLSEPKVFEQDVVLSRLAGADAEHVWAVGGGAIFFRVSE